MGSLRLFLTGFFCHLVAAHPLQNLEDNSISFQDLGGFFENDPFPFERDFSLFPPFNDIFGSWKRWMPGFNMDEAFPPLMSAPRVRLSCNEDKMTVLVDKKTFDLMLTAKDVQLGDGCKSTQELPDKIIFSYGLDECGTKPLMQNDMKVFMNFLTINPKKSLSPWLQTPLTVHVSCVPARSQQYQSVIPAPYVPEKSFNIQAMDSSWTSPAPSNIYKRGQLMHLQASADIKPNQQLYIHSCSVSASPEPQTKPRNAVILNKGCSSSLGSPHIVAQFVHSKTPDVVNFILNTSHLTSELYIHCSIFVSDQGITPLSKSCNYDASQSRWIEINGDIDVCACCSTKCKSQSAKPHAGDVKVIVSSDLFIVNDEDVKGPAPTSEPRARKFVPSLPASGATFVQRKAASSQPGVVVVSQDPTSRLTLWLPGQADAGYGNDGTSWSEDGFSIQTPQITEDYSEILAPTADVTLLPMPAIEAANPINENLGEDVLWDMNIPTGNNWQTQTANEDFHKDEAKAAQDITPPNEMSIDILLLKPHPVMAEDAAVEHDSTEDWKMSDPKQDDSDSIEKSVPEEPAKVDKATEDDQPIIRSKLEFSKGADGSQKLSYEEELKQQAAHKAAGIKEPRIKGLRSTFLHLMGKMNKAE